LEIRFFNNVCKVVVNNLKYNGKTLIFIDFEGNKFFSYQSLCPGGLAVPAGQLILVKFVTDILTEMHTVEVHNFQYRF